MRHVSGHIPLGRTRKRTGPSSLHLPIALPWPKPCLFTWTDGGDGRDLRVGGAEDKHGAVGHHGFARLTLLLLLLLLLHLLLLFDLCLLQGTGFAISLVADCKGNMRMSSETLPHARMEPLVIHWGWDGGAGKVPREVPCTHAVFVSYKESSSCSPPSFTLILCGIAFAI